MIGVVLWSDKRKNQAVIWCEDHGDLAFYKSPGAEGERVSVTAGDLVEFELRDDAALRIATCPQVIEKESFPSLSGELRKAGMAMGALETGGDLLGQEAVDVMADNIVPFEPRRLDEVA